MLGVRHSVRQKVVALAAVALLLAGGAFAAVSAVGAGNDHRGRAHRATVRLHARDVTAAAGYLGVPADTLVAALDSHQSLAQIAAAHGKSVQGLVDAIVAARRARLAKVSAQLPRRIGTEVEKPVASATDTPSRGAGRPARTPRASHPATSRQVLDVFTSKGRLGVTAAAYLGVTPAKLRHELASGKTLAQLAASTPGKSTSGLEAKLLAARSQRVAQRLSSGRIAQARAARITRRLSARIDALVQRRFASGASHG
ncbi:MAG TPA: hypothetical protein VL988_02640 [Solirubrobacteraceae bacterium]|nr:hypothetical protein [Solirubrobacteraceae bacterium]